MVMHATLHFLSMHFYRYFICVLLLLATAPSLYAPHLDYRGVVSYSESEKAQLRRDADQALSRSSSSSSSFSSFGLNDVSVPSPDWEKMRANLASIEAERAAQRKRDADNYNRQVQFVSAIQKHINAMSAGEQHACVAQAIEHLNGTPAFPEKSRANVLVKPELAAGSVSRITTGPNAHWSPLWAAALAAFAGGRPEEGIVDRLNGAMMEKHPDVAFNLALAILLDPKASPMMHPDDWRKFEREFRDLAARALHQIAQRPPDARPQLSLARAAAALAVRAQNSSGGLSLSPEAARLVQHTLNASGASGIDTMWTTFLGNATARAVAMPATNALDLDALPHLARGCTQRVGELLNAIVELRPNAPDQRPRWLDEPAINSLFRRVFEDSLSSKHSRENPTERKRAELGLNQLLAYGTQPDLSPVEREKRMQTVLNTLRQNPQDPALPGMLPFALAYALQDVTLTSEPSAAQIDTAIEIAAAIGWLDPNVQKRYDDPRAPSFVIPYLLDLRRQHFPAYASGGATPMIARIAEHFGETVQLAEDSAKDIRPALTELAALARTERSGSPQQRAALDALGFFNSRIFLHHGVSELVQPIYSEPPGWWLRHWPTDRWPVGHGRHPADGFRIVLRDRAEMLALTLMAYFKTDDSAARSSLKATIRKLVFSTDAPVPAWELLGRDLAVGGLATRALLHEQSLDGTTGKSEARGLTAKDANAGFELWLKGVGDLISRVPATETIDEIVRHIEHNKHRSGVISFSFRQWTMEGLANAAEVVTHDTADTIGSAAWRRYALAQMIKLAPYISKVGIYDSTRKSGTELVDFFTARAEWEISKLDQPELSPIERAKPLVAKLGTNTAVLAFMARTDLTVRFESPKSVPRQLLFEPDPAFAPALLRAAASLPDQEPLITRYLKGEYPREEASWQKLAEGKSW